jgi:hypothetical protein
VSATTVRGVPMPSRIRALPRDQLGRPIPWFVADLEDGGRDFRDADRRIRALRDRLCWVCGQRLPRRFVFVLGPMCALNRITAEPPAHEDCADYSARVCPFMLRPQMVRRTSGIPEGTVAPPGKHLDRNPGGMLLWTTNDWTTFRPPFGMQTGLLINVGEPMRVSWWREGRAASRVEAEGMLDAGYARLQEEARQDIDPDSAFDLLARQYRRARALLPPS